MVVEATPRLRRELASDARAGSWARANARRRQLEWLRHRWVPVTAILLLLCTPLGAIPFISNDFFAGVVAGGVVVGAPALLWFLVLTSTSTSPTMMGDEAEQWTAQELRKALRASSPKPWLQIRRDRAETSNDVWALINHIPFQNHDIDHVLISPSGVLVVETKWSASSWSDRYGQNRQRDAVAQVTSNARLVRVWADKQARLTEHGVPVHAVVVLWGGQRTDALFEPPDHACTVVHGNDLAAWVRSLPPVPQTSQVAGPLWRLLAKRIDDQTKHDPDAARVPVRAGDQLGRIAQMIFAATVSILGVSSLFAVTGSLSGFAAAMLIVAGLGWRYRRNRVMRPVALGSLLGIGILTVFLLVALGRAWF